MPASPTILILAAGASSRMQGRDKLLEPVEGQPILARITRAALETGCPVRVVLPPGRPLRLAALAGLPVQTVICENAAEGMAASLACGVAACPEADILLLLADLPEIGADDLEAMLIARKAHPGRILRACAEDGTAGHPVLFPAALRAKLLSLKGDEGARTLLRAPDQPVIAVPLPGRRAVTDLDTPEDWAAWRASR